MFAGSMPSQSWTLRWLERPEKPRSTRSEKTREEGKS
jgi:hypothetical protein